MLWLLCGVRGGRFAGIRDVLPAAGAGVLRHRSWGERCGHAATLEFSACKLQVVISPGSLIALQEVVLYLGDGVLVFGTVGGVELQALKREDVFQDDAAASPVFFHRLIGLLYLRGGPGQGVNGFCFRWFTIVLGVCPGQRHLDRREYRIPACICLGRVQRQQLLHRQGPGSAVVAVGGHVGVGHDGWFLVDIAPIGGSSFSLLYALRPINRGFHKRISIQSAIRVIPGQLRLPRIILRRFDLYGAVRLYLHDVFALIFYAKHVGAVPVEVCPIRYHKGGDARFR